MKNQGIAPSANVCTSASYPVHLSSSISMDQQHDSVHAAEEPANIEQSPPTVLQPVKSSGIPDENRAEGIGDHKVSAPEVGNSEMINGFTSNGEQVEVSEVVPSLERRVTYSVQILQLIEEHNLQLNEVMRRNEDKRETIAHLTDRVEKLMAENHSLQEENYRLMIENRALASKAKDRKKLSFFSRSSSSGSKHDSPPLKSLSLSPLRGRSSTGRFSSCLSPFQGGSLRSYTPSPSLFRGGSPASHSSCFSSFRVGGSPTRNTFSS